MVDERLDTTEVKMTSATYRIEKPVTVKRIGRGEVELEVDGKVRTLLVGDVLLVTLRLSV